MHTYIVECDTTSAGLGPGPVLACIARAIMKFHLVAHFRSLCTSSIRNAKIGIARENGLGRPTETEPLLALVLAIHELNTRALGDGLWMPTVVGYVRARKCMRIDFVRNENNTKEKYGYM